MSVKTKIMVNRVMHSMMLSCDTATFYVTKKDYQKLSCKENFQLKLHLMACSFCRSFNNQNAIISDKIKLMDEHPPAAELSPEKKQEIEKCLKG
jgi:hypothetical protein